MKTYPTEPNTIFRVGKSWGTNGSIRKGSSMMNRSMIAGAFKILSIIQDFLFPKLQIVTTSDSD
ncbi:MAG: hypothetical protein JKY52_20155 [Flavobacteriales bacterium]|nr:hypothetical protein [Flavobacteriales bacterium]